MLGGFWSSFFICSSQQDCLRRKVGGNSRAARAPGFLGEIGISTAMLGQEVEVWQNHRVPTKEGESMSHFRSVEQDGVGSQPGQCTQKEAMNPGNRVQPGQQSSPERR